MNLSREGSPERVDDLNAERALRDEIAELEMANRTLADFGVLVSHDLANAQRRIVGFAELLRLIPALQADPHTVAFLDTILSSSQKIQNCMARCLANRPEWSAKPKP